MHACVRWFPCCRLSSVLALVSGGACALVSLRTLRATQPVHLAYVEGDALATLRNCAMFMQRDMQSLVSVLSIAVMGETAAG